MPRVPVKGRVLYQNRIPIGNALVDIFDDDTSIGRRGMSTRTDQIGTLTTNENGWFEDSFDFAFGDLPRIKVKVRKDGRTTGWMDLPAGEPQLVTDWAGPRLHLQHESPDIAARLARRELRTRVLKSRSQNAIAGSSVPFGQPIVSLEPLPSTGTPLDQLGVLPVLTQGGLTSQDTPPVLPTPFYLKERGEAADVHSVAANRARSRRQTLIDAGRAGYADMFKPLLDAGGSLAFAPVQKPRSLELMGDGAIADAFFAEQRIAGANPMTIARVGSEAAPSVPTEFAFANANFVKTHTRWTLDQLKDAKRLFLCDYRMLVTPFKDFSKPSSAATATMGLFYLADPEPLIVRRRAKPGERLAVTPARVVGTVAAGVTAVGGAAQPAVPPTPAAPATGMTLMPLAIVLLNKDGWSTTVTPGQPRWGWAKTVMQSNDVVLHEMRYHLWNCHFAMEPVVLAMVRQLDEYHPLRQLLVRHSYGLLWINNTGFNALINMNGPAHRLLGMTLDGVARTLADSQAAWSWRSTSIKADIDRRGLGADALPDYPYRTDGLRLFEEIRCFTGEYVDVYYDNDAEVGRDDELRAFLVEAASFSVGGLPDARTKAILADFLAEYIFQMSVQHAAVNTPQWDYISYSLNMGGALMPPPPGQADDPVRQAPGVDEAIDMMELMGQLAMFFFEPKGLGHYRDMWTDDRNRELAFSDSAAEAAAVRFRDRLEGLRTVMAQERRPLRYPYLDPRMLDNSTHK